MKMHTWWTRSAIMLPLILCASHGMAQGVDPEKLQKVGCSELIYSQQFLKQYPKAPAACLEARVYKGVRYAKFSGKVYIPGSDAITVQVFNVAGDTLSAVTFKPSPSARVIIDGKKVPFKDLKKGDPLTFWVSEKRFAVYTAPGATHSASKAVAPAP